MNCEVGSDLTGKGTDMSGPYDRHCQCDLVLDNENAREHFERVAADLSDQTNAGIGGRGVVVCGGGLKYLTCAWVCVNMLRRMKCELPVELWHFGEREVPAGMVSLFKALGVTCVDAEKVRQKYPVRTLNGWELKAFAIIHSSFEEVLLLDADNVAILDPTFLFDTPEYQKTEQFSGQTTDAWIRSGRFGI